MKRELMGAILALAIFVLLWAGCGLWSNWRYVTAYPRTEKVTSMWESHQVRSWIDSTEVVDLYSLRVGYYWADVDSQTFHRLRVGDTLTVSASRESLFSHGRYIGTLWPMYYPARIEE